MAPARNANRQKITISSVFEDLGAATVTGGTVTCGGAICGIGGGYLVYGWRQKESIPLVGGVVMTLACFLPALPMTLVSLATMAAVWWLCKQGY